MRPYRRPELLLLGVGVFLQLLDQTTSYSSDGCLTRQFYDEFETESCIDCKQCIKNSRRESDGAQIVKRCKEKNTEPEFLGDLETYFWCLQESKDVKDKIKELTATTPEDVQTSATPGVRETKPASDNLGTVAFPLIGVGVFLLFVILIVGLIVWIVHRRKWQSLSLSSLPTESDGLSEESQELNPNEPEVIIDSPDRIREDCQRRPVPSPPLPVQIYVDIFTTPEVRVSKGDNVILDSSEKWGDDPTVAWLHKETNNPFIGSKVTISSIKGIQCGEYIASNGPVSASVTVTLVRPGEENEEPRVICRRQPVERGPEAVESSTETGSPEENEQSVTLWQPATNSQPASGDSNAPIVPSGQSHANLHRLVEQVNSLINFADQRREVEYRRCPLNLEKLLQDAVATQQLAILLDPTNMLRLFAAREGRMSVDEIDYVWYCMKGTGNIVRGLFQHLVDKGYSDCTAADFSNFMIKAGWKGCDKLIHLVYQVHLKREEHCTECEALHKSYGPKEMSGDVRLQNVLPGYQYHINNELCHCEQTVFELSRCRVYGEAFRQDSPEQFCVNELWRFVGSDLVGMSMEFLEQIQKHYDGAERYLQMLDYLVGIYPELLVATLLQWLLDHNHMRAAKLVLEHHEEQMKGLKDRECAFCRTIRNKHFPYTARQAMS